MNGTEEDYLYHLGLGTKSNDLKTMFGDVKFICMGGSAKRMRNFAQLLADQFGVPVGPDLSGHADRYCMYKVGPVVAVNHGIGMSSLLVLLHELVKIVRHVQIDKDVIFIRIGTSGGIGVEPGTVVVTNSAVDECMNTFCEMVVCGQKVQRPTKFDVELAKEVHQMSEQLFNFPVKLGTTMSSNDFYEGQGRLDGAICDHTAHDKMTYLNRLAEAGVINIEMEALLLGAFLNHCNLKGLVVCVTMLNRLLGDQIQISTKEKHDFELRPQQIVAEFIKTRLAL